MDEKEREIYAQQHKDRVDLNEQQSKVWRKFLKRKQDYSQKYGATYADILLKKEKEALEAELGQDHKDLDQRHDQQWLNYHENDPKEKPYNLPQFLKGPEPIKGQSEKAIDKDITAGSASLLEQYRQRTLQKDQQEGKDSDAKDGTQMENQARETLYSNPFKQPNKEQLNASLSQTNDLEQSQDYMIAMRSVPKENPRKETEQRAEMKPGSMSARFSQGLSYTKAAEKTDKSSKQEKDMDRD